MLYGGQVWGRQRFSCLSACDMPGLMGRPEKVFQRLSHTCLFTLHTASSHNMARGAAAKQKTAFLRFLCCHLMHLFQSYQVGVDCRHVAEASEDPSTVLPAWFMAEA